MDDPTLAGAAYTSVNAPGAAYTSVNAPGAAYTSVTATAVAGVSRSHTVVVQLDCEEGYAISLTKVDIAGVVCAGWEFDARSIGTYVEILFTSMRACEATGYAPVSATVAADKWRSAAAAACIPCAEGGGRGTSDGDTAGVAWAWWEPDVGS